MWIQRKVTYRKEEKKVSKACQYKRKIAKSDVNIRGVHFMRTVENLNYNSLGMDGGFKLCNFGSNKGREKQRKQPLS